MTTGNREFFELIDIIAAADGQDWPDYWASAAQRQTGVTMYGAIAQGILDSSWRAELRARPFVGQGGDQP